MPTTEFKLTIFGATMLMALSGCAGSRSNGGGSMNPSTAAAARPAAVVELNKPEDPPPAQAANASAAEKKQEDLRLYFDAGQARLRDDSRAILDQAARLFRDGNPVVMIVSGQTDTIGDSQRNLLLSQSRANGVAKALIDRGIPAARLQVLAKGESELLVKTADGVSQAENRAVVISWR